VASIVRRERFCPMSSYSCCDAFSCRQRAVLLGGTSLRPILLCTSSKGLETLENTEINK